MLYAFLVRYDVRNYKIVVKLVNKQSVIFLCVRSKFFIMYHLAETNVSRFLFEFSRAKDQMNMGLLIRVIITISRISIIFFSCNNIVFYGNNIYIRNKSIKEKEFLGGWNVVRVHIRYISNILIDHCAHIIDYYY